MTHSAISPQARADVEHRISELGKWFQNLNLDGVQTLPIIFLVTIPR